MYVLPLFNNDITRSFPLKNLTIMDPVISSKSFTFGKLIALFRPYFWQSLFCGAKEFRLDIDWMRKLAKQSLIVGTLKQYININPSLNALDLWYFYWGTNSLNVLPFLEVHPKSVCRFHRYDLYGKDCLGGEHQLFQGLSAKKLRKAYFVSEDGMNYFSQKHKNITTSMKVSRLGVPDRGVASASVDGVLRVVTSSNIYKVKRLELVARAIAQLTTFKVVWTHFGDGPRSLVSEVKRAASKAGNNVQVKFMGRVKNFELMRYYKANPVDLFINVSESEGLPVSIMEALSFGIPVIATDVGGTREIVNDDVGKLVSSSISDKQLAREISEFYCKKYGVTGVRESCRREWSQKVQDTKNYDEFIKDIKNV